MVRPSGRRGREGGGGGGGGGSGWDLGEEMVVMEEEIGGERGRRGDTRWSQSG